MRKYEVGIGFLWTVAALAAITIVLSIMLFVGTPSCVPGPKPPGLTWAQWAPERAAICENAQ